MLFALAGIAASISPSPSPTPSPFPTVEAVVHAAAPVVTHPGLWDVLNQLASQVSQADVIAAAAVAVVGLQYLLNHFKQLNKFANQLVGIALPFAALLPATVFTDPHNMQYGPAIYVAGQFLYYVVERIRKQNEDTSTPAPAALPADGLPRTTNP